MSKDQMIELMEKINRGRKDNIESRRSALNTLVGAFPVGGKVFAVVALDELHIDESYQRSLQNHVKVIARDWNPNKCDPLKINFREDGFFYVWDGQHRLEAARLRGIKYLLFLNQIKNMDMHMDILIMRMVIRAMEVYHVQVHMHGE